MQILPGSVGCSNGLKFWCGLIFALVICVILAKKKGAAIMELTELIKVRLAEDFETKRLMPNCKMPKRPKGRNQRWAIRSCSTESIHFRELMTTSTLKKEPQLTSSPVLTVRLLSLELNNVSTLSNQNAEEPKLLCSFSPKIDEAVSLYEPRSHATQIGIKRAVQKKRFISMSWSVQIRFSRELNCRISRNYAYGIAEQWRFIRIHRCQQKILQKLTKSTRTVLFSLGKKISNNGVILALWKPGALQELSDGTRFLACT